MLSLNDFIHKQIIVFCPAQGDKISYRSIVLVLLGALVLVTLICLLWRMRKKQ